jgi:polyvinyl alcohol dehydrogenase (cytochrome)
MMSSLLFAADPEGSSIYKTRCAVCHEASSVTRAPDRIALSLTSPETIIRALESGLMKEQGSALSSAERQEVARFITGRSAGLRPDPAAGMCSGGRTEFSLSGPAWNGWGVDLNNTRFQPTNLAGLTADQVPGLKVKWAFAFPDTFISNGQPSVVGGRLFVPSANRRIYSLDAKTGCQYWVFEPDAPVRSAFTVVTLNGAPRRMLAFFGDRRGTAYAIDAATAELIWKVKVDETGQSAGISAAPAYYDGRLYVPLTAGGEGVLDLKTVCCRSRGALAALDAATGKVLWKTYTIPEEPRITGTNKAGTPIWGPSGASIWSSPTVDVERKLIYAGTGDNFSDPPNQTSDAILAFDMQTGKVAWSKQLTERDAYTVGCRMNNKAGCPESNGPDFDIGAPPILVRLSGGRRVLLVSQKSGIARALDPDMGGEILWAYRVGRGSPLGGIQWGSATDGVNMYVANSDISFTKRSFEQGEKRILDPNMGGGLFAISIATGEKIWAAPPPSCGGRLFCSPAQSAAVTAIPGVVFSGSEDGHIRGYSTRDGKVIWDYDTAHEYTAINDAPAKGGALDCPGPVVAGGMLYVASGYGSWGGLPGNVLLAFSVDGK